MEQGGENTFLVSRFSLGAIVPNEKRETRNGLFPVTRPALKDTNE
jgi:hypothetical protein